MEGSKRSQDFSADTLLEEVQHRSKLGMTDHIHRNCLWDMIEDHKCELNLLNFQDSLPPQIQIHRMGEYLVCLHYCRQDCPGA